MKKDIRHRGWNDMNRLLDEHMPIDDKPIALWWWGSAAAVLLVAGLSWYVLSTRSAERLPILSHFELEQGIDDTNQKTVINAVAESSREKDMTDTRSTSVNDSDIFEGITSAPNTEPQGQPLTRETDRLAITAHADIEVIDENTVITTESETNAISRNNDLAFGITEELPTRDNKGMVTKGFDNSTKAIDMPYLSSPKAVSHPLMSRFVMLSLGSNVTVPFSIVSQFDIGLERSISKKWAYQVGLGAGINGLYYNPDVALMERSGSSRRSNVVIPDHNSQISNSSEVDIAAVDVNRNFFAHTFGHLVYRMNDQWQFLAGVEMAYRFGISIDELFHTGETTSGSFSSLSYTGEEIEQLFVIFNRWDIRPSLGVGYDFNARFGLHLRYRHGLNGLIAHPVDGFNSAYTRNVQMGLMYRF